MNVVSLFSGGGGLDLGFISEGFDVIWAIDNEPNAVATYKKNIGEHIVLADINKIDIHQIPKADILLGGPPCQSFSLAGKRDKADPRGMLVWRYLEILKYIKPKAFVFENVTGLQSAKNSDGIKVLEILQAEFKKLGYSISTQVMNAVEYGVPQRRKRLIIVGLRDGMDFQFPLRTHGDNLIPYVSVSDALDDLKDITADDSSLVSYLQPPKTDYQALMRNMNNLQVSEHITPQMSKLDKYIISHVKQGGNYMDIPKDVASARIKRLQEQGGHTTCYGRLDETKPAYTINTYFNRPNVGCNIHYANDRLITVREALRLQSFPDSYELVSTSKQGKHKIVGNAVPPLLAKAIAKRLKEYL